MKRREFTQSIIAAGAASVLPLELNALVARYEAPGVTYIADDYPIAWASAHGALA